MNDYPYRLGVEAFIVDSEKNFLIVKKQFYNENEWGLAGGGLEKDEAEEAGLMRELLEELGTDKFEITLKSPAISQFDWPQQNIDNWYEKHGEHYRGQRKYQYIVRFTGLKEEIKMQETELKAIKWVRYADLKTLFVFPGQWENAEKVLSGFVD